MTQAFRAQGTALEVEEDATPGTFMRIAEMRNINPSITADQLDVSNHDTPNAWREFIGGMVTGQMALEGNYLPTHESQDGDTGLLKFLQDGRVRLWRITTPVLADLVSQYRWTFSGVLVEYSPTFQADQAATFTGRLMISGQPTYAVIS